jgi:hypothetical protein
LFKSDDITNRGTLDVKLASVIWRILLKHAVKMDSVVEFSAVVSSAMRMLPMHDWDQVSGPSKDS